MFTALAQWIMNVSNNKMAYHTVQDVRNQAFQKIQILPLKYMDDHSYGEVVSRVIADVDQFSDGLLMGFTQLFTGVITILGTLLFMLTFPSLWQTLLPRGHLSCSNNSQRHAGIRLRLWRK